MRVLVTGSAGFIGFHTCSHLLGAGAQVLGIDNFNHYYDVRLKEQRNQILEQHDSFSLARISIDDANRLNAVWKDYAPDVVIHLAAQAGVRHSIDNPQAYIANNVIGTFNVFEACRSFPVNHLLVASTSSVYGANTDMPFHEGQCASSPMSLYAATKSATELMGHSYSYLFRTPMTFFRFFTVYGPWGRPDMALFKFTKAISEGAPIDLYNNGNMVRDFTYIDDLAASIVRLVDAVPGGEPVENDSLSPVAPFRIVNIGGGKPTPLMEYVRALEQALGTTARKNMLPMQLGDVPATEASTDLLRRLTGHVPCTPVEQGVAAFVAWYREHFGTRDQ